MKAVTCFFLLFPGGYPINVTNVFNIPCDIVFEINFLKFIFLNTVIGILVKVTKIS